jgi:hypothetical protein
MLEAYLKTAISTWISIEAFSLDDRESMINAWLTILMIGFMAGFPIFIYFFLKRNTHRLAEEEFMARFESIYLNVDPEVKYALLTVPLFVFRRLLYSANIVLLSNSSVS